MLFANPNAQRCSYDAALHSVLNMDACRQSRQWLAPWPLLLPGPTPIWPMPALARALGVAHVQIKDESLRSSLGSFKVLGAPVALLRLVMRRWPERRYKAQDLLAGRHAQEMTELVVISATDGNHGRALAAAAQSLGCGCVIVLHAQVSAEREAPIAALGARIVRIDGNYDASVIEAARLGAAQGWQVVSDTSTGGYEDIARDVMQGYAILADELLSAEPADAPCPYTHVIVQGGVGGLAAGVVSYFWERYGTARPCFIVVEPDQADCLLQSARQGCAAATEGTVDSIMAGLACGETSPLAWRFLQPAVDFFLSVPDSAAVQAMRTLAIGAGGDIPVLSGESGAAGLAGLQTLMADPALAAQAGLDAHSRVLLFNTEGDTAPAIYQSLVGPSGARVRAAQAGWLAEQGIDAAALCARIDAHAQVGATPDGGVCRMALTDADRAGRDRLVQWMRELGLQVQVDQIGNLFGIRAGSSDAAPVMTGSHIDTVATGGRYDGVLGVMAGLEVVRWLNQHGVHTHRGLVVAAFTNEEGVRFAPDMMGSLVHAGGYPLAQALDTRDAQGVRLGDELARIGYAGPWPCGTLRPYAFVELHVEQGPLLHAQGLCIGAVQGVQGILWQEITVEGEANHAGTTPMAMRRDAGHSAAAIAVFVRALTDQIPGLLGTVGAVRLEPGLINVIAARGTLQVDLRHPDEAALAQAEQALAEHLDVLAAQQGVRIQRRVLARLSPVGFDQRLMRRIEAAAAVRQLPCRRMSSGAGHDAQMMARMAPTAMVFVPSVGGISHNPREHTEATDLVQGANVLLDVLLGLTQAVSIEF